MIVVSNTSPITNLHAVGELGVLRSLYGAIYIPPAVFQELQAGLERGAHPSLEAESDWLLLHRVRGNISLVGGTQLDLGEREAITLAVQMHADLILLDDWVGRRVARAQGLQVMGTLGVLIAAKRSGVLPAVRPVLDNLIQQAGFWVSEALYQQVLTAAGED